MVGKRYNMRGRISCIGGWVMIGGNVMNERYVMRV